MVPGAGFGRHQLSLATRSITSWRQTAHNNFSFKGEKMTFKGFLDKAGANLEVGDSVNVLKDADGWRGHLRQVTRLAGFKAKVVGFAGASQVVVEADGLRYNLESAEVEKTA
jgi:hypothetical protein